MWEGEVRVWEGKGVEGIRFRVVLSNIAPFSQLFNFLYPLNHLPLERGFIMITDQIPLYQSYEPYFQWYTTNLD